MQADPPSRGCIVTFYSYKGGTGRTMALANVACLLADAGENVLVVDWDLEAPGLHRFFPPRLRRSSNMTDLGLDDTPGVIDLFCALRENLPAAKPESDDEAEAAVERAFEGIDPEACIRDTAIPGVRIMRAGRNDDGGYSRRVGTFDWEGVFQRAPGIYRAFADRLTERYRWVLVDSRTGVTDISGICTSLLPERLVVVFTPNRQSLTGVRELVQRATDYRRSSDDLRPLLVYPLPSRIETSLQDLRARWRFGDPDREVIGYEPMFEELLARSYGLQHCDLSAYFDEVQIQQTPDYAYGEEIAVRRSGDRFSMANSYIVFTDRLKSGEPPWHDAEADTAAVARDSAARPAPTAARPQTTPPRLEPFWNAAAATGPQVFLSYAYADRDKVMTIAAALADRNLRVHADRTLEPGSDYSATVSHKLDASEAVVVFWSHASVESTWVKAEAEEGLRRGILVPVLLDDVSPPLAFRSVQSADLRRPTPEAMERFIDAVDRVAAGTPGTVMYPSPYQPPLADTWTGGINPAPAPAASTRRFELPLAIVGVVVLLFAAGWIGISLLSTKGKPPETGAQTTPPPVPGVTVPNFVGTDSADVARTADLIGLSVQMSDGRTQAPFLEGIVTSQSPAAGSTVPRSTHIELRVATRTVPAPTLVGTQLNSALAALERSGLQLGRTETQFVADAKPGTIVRQRPEAGAAAAAGSPVDVVVAATAAPASKTRSLTNESQGTVPDLRGLTEAEAVLAIRRAGLRVGLVSTRSGSPPTVGKVVDQSPARGSRVRMGTAVHLTVSAAASAR